MFSEFTLTPTPTTENTVEKETVKIADKQAPVCRHLKQKTTDHIDEELRKPANSHALGVSLTPEG